MDQERKKKTKKMYIKINDEFLVQNVFVDVQPGAGRRVDHRTCAARSWNGKTKLVS